MFSKLDNNQRKSELTRCQQSALKSIKEFLSNKKEQVFVLSGYAGSGKSFLISRLVGYLSEQEVKYICASPTNKAAKNLVRLGIEKSTMIAKLLGQVPKLDENLGKEIFTRKDNQEEEFSDYQVIIIDEYSMINQENFSEIQYELLLAPKTKIIFVGDPAQLPPVKEDKPAVEIAQHQYNYPCASLSEIVRYDGEIAKVAEDIRSNPIYNKKSYPFHQVTDDTIEVLARRDWSEKAISFFMTKDFENYPDYCRVIAFTNYTCDRANEVIRRRLFPNAESPFVKGDRLIAKSPLFRWSGKKKKKDQEWNIICQTSEEMEVIESAKILPYKLPFKEKDNNYSCYSFSVITEDDRKINLVVPTEDTQKEIDSQLAKYKKNKNWYDYYRLLKCFDNVGYCYALTCHKAQGSGFDYVFLDIGDMKKCDFQQKIIYTALTRARKKAFVRY